MNAMPDQSLEFSARVRTCLWFDKNGHEAARFYVTLLADSHIETVIQPDPQAPPLVVEFRLAGAPYMILNGGPHDTLNDAASIAVLTKDQAELDALWDKLLADGGEARWCGWLKDRFGLSWQIVPEIMPRMLNASDRTAAARVRDVMMTMQKIDSVTLEAAFQGVPRETNTRGERP